MNANKLAISNGADYKTVKQHLDLLTKHRLLVPTGEDYGKVYFISPELEENWQTFLKIYEKLKPKLQQVKGR